MKQSNEDRLQKEFAQWQSVYKYGCNDPFWSDGRDLNLIRNHIEYFKSRIKEAHPDGDCPEIYYRKTPLEVDQNFMVQVEKIKSNAKQVLVVCQNDSNYKFLLNTALGLNPKSNEKICINNVIGYVRHLEQSIMNNDLITMRRANAESYAQTFRDCAEKVKNIMKSGNEIVNEQLGLF